MLLPTTTFVVGAFPTPESVEHGILKPVVTPQPLLTGVLPPLLQLLFNVYVGLPPTLLLVATNGRAHGGGMGQACCCGHTGGGAHGQQP